MTSIDLRPRLPPVRDQGPRGTCVAFAVTAAHALARSAGAGGCEDLSEEALHWNCRQRDRDPTRGAAFTVASDVLREIGQPLAATWPYDGGRDEDGPTYVPPREALDPRYCFRARLIEISPEPGNIRECLANGQAVALGIPIFLSFLTAPMGRVALPTATDPPAGKHAVLAVGWDDDPAQWATLVFRNSWGSEWGMDGCGFLPCDYLLRYRCEAWIVEL